MTDNGDVTQLLEAWSAGNQSALQQLVPLVERELHRIALACMARERQGHSLQATALVNEAYVRLVDVRKIDWHGRAHFLALAARTMRRILVDHARARGYQKRGGKAVHVALDDLDLPGAEPTHQLVALHDALQRLEVIDPRKSRVIELRFFGGLTVEETATVLAVSPETVMRDWKLARAWILRELVPGADSPQR